MEYADDFLKFADKNIKEKSIWIEIFPNEMTKQESIKWPISQNIMWFLLFPVCLQQIAMRLLWMEMANVVFIWIEIEIPIVFKSSFIYPKKKSSKQEIIASNEDATVRPSKHKNENEMRWKS